MSERIFTADWFTCLIPIWEFLVVPLIPRGPVRCLEIGSYEGKASCWILDTLIKNHPDSHLDCVDLWPDMGEQERLFDHNLSAEPQVTKHRDFSVNFLAPLVTQPPTYDFIYVDGDKRGEVLFSDLCLAWRCLKKKGVLAIDEYVYDGVDIAGVPGPQIAIDAFLKIIGREVRLLERNRQFIIQKRSEPLSAQDPL